MPCGALDDGAEYSIQFRMNDTTAKALYMEMSKSYQANKKDKWADKLERPFVKDDEGMFTHKANLKGAYSNNKTTKPLQVDAQGTKLPDDFLLTTGSTVNVAVTFNPYDFGGKQNVNLRLKAVQVVKYVPMEDRNPFEAVDGFTIDEEISPFKILSREDLNKIDEEPKEEEVIEEQENSIPQLSDEQKKQLAAEAAKQGVMQAVSSDEQGSSGWYVDVSEEIQYWNVGADGSWTRGD